jgi:sterol desaturase/sphingolipid hydroxylase (fatty acid hydroxylase superfamily)
MSEISKSKSGLPDPQFPQGVDLRVESRKARHRLYPVSALYSAYAWTIVVLALRSGAHPLAVAGYFLAGAATWTYVEYFAHRYVLHGRFPDGPAPLQRFLHKSFDHLHYEHHARPWDGDHINGTIGNTIVFVTLFAALSFLAPLHTLPVFVAGLVQSYILEEWVHHSVHFYAFNGRYFSYIRKHHLYHHSPRGSEVGFGLTNGFWDIVRQTRIPEEQRRRLYGRKPGFLPPAAEAENRPEERF